MALILGSLKRHDHRKKYNKNKKCVDNNKKYTLKKTTIRVGIDRAFGPGQEIEFSFNNNYKNEAQRESRKAFPFYFLGSPSSLFTQTLSKHASTFDIMPVKPLNIEYYPHTVNANINHHYSFLIGKPTKRDA